MSIKRIGGIVISLISSTYDINFVRFERFTVRVQQGRDTSKYEHGAPRVVCHVGRSWCGHSALLSYTAPSSVLTCLWSNGQLTSNFCELFSVDNVSRLGEADRCVLMKHVLPESGA